MGTWVISFSLWSISEIFMCTVYKKSRTFQIAAENKYFI